MADGAELGLGGNPLGCHLRTPSAESPRPGHLQGRLEETRHHWQPALANADVLPSCAPEVALQGCEAQARVRPGAEQRAARVAVQAVDHALAR